ncbi:MAG: hypothetical protein Q4E34_05945 [Synergistaceae bacterium]|nr:hypothetical protein [Synergistaceae bacterium]
MLVYANCGRVLKECCDIFVEVVDENGNDAGVVCGECVAEIEGEKDND